MIGTRREQFRAEVIVVGGGVAGLSAAIYLGRAERDVLVIDTGKSMARWEPEVENFLGFPDGIDGAELLERGRRQARANGARLMHDEIMKGTRKEEGFVLHGNSGAYEAQRVLLATGAFHIPPEIQGVPHCLGHSMFFCKDCDAFRVRGKRIAIYGHTQESVDYALGMLFYSPSVAIVTDGKKPQWGPNQDEWLAEYDIPVYAKTIEGVRRQGCQIRSLKLRGGEELEVDALFTTRGDLFMNKLARSLGAALDETGQIIVDGCMRTSVKGVYAAGCVTPANCQIIIAAGQGAAAAQAINRDLFEQSLATHSLRRFRGHQLRTLHASGARHDRRYLRRVVSARA